MLCLGFFLFFSRSNPNVVFPTHDISLFDMYTVYEIECGIGFFRASQIGYSILSVYHRTKIGCSCSSEKVVLSNRKQFFFLLQNVLITYFVPFNPVRCSSHTAILHTSLFEAEFFFFTRNIRNGKRNNDCSSLPIRINLIYIHLGDGCVYMRVDCQIESFKRIYRLDLVNVSRFHCSFLSSIHSLFLRVSGRRFFFFLFLSPFSLSFPNKCCVHNTAILRS